MKNKTVAQDQETFFKQALYVLFFLLIARLISMAWIPLNDSTEARYGEIARKMLETGDWLVLQLEYGIPFWAKPPLSTWLSAFSMKCFGVNEFAVRLPGLVLSIGVLFFIWNLAKTHSSKLVAIAAVLFLSGTFYFFLDAGTVMTDPALLFCSTLAMTSFWRGCVDSHRMSSYLFFIGLGIGLLAKGPIILVLVGLPIFVWLCLRRQWGQLWRRFPWITGVLLMGIIAVPWYVLLERRTPGFINYFLIGEHIQRFLEPGWTGDKYGSAHHAPWGMIWVYLIIGIFPWNLIGPVWIKNYWRKVPEIYRDEDGWMCYLFCWLLVPLLFFTFASNIIYPYVFPVLPAYALILAEGWQRSMQEGRGKQWILWGSTVVGLVFIGATVLFHVLPTHIGKTQKPLIEAWKAQHPAPHSKLIYWDYGGHYSARFYAAGQVTATATPAELCRLLEKGDDNYLVISEHNVVDIPAALFAKGTLVKSVNFNGNESLLMHFAKIHC